MEDFKLEVIQQNGVIGTQISNSDSASKFNIPALKPKTPGTGLKLIGSTGTLEDSSSNINQFLLKQLEQQGNNGKLAVGRFNVPKLEKGLTTKNFVIPELKSSKSGKTPPIGSIVPNLQQDIQGLQNKQDEECKRTPTAQAEDQIIDLTTALSSTIIGSSNNVIGANQRKKTQSEIFEIPFIDCDRQQQMPQTDNYCLLDISHIRFQHNLAQPSTLGRILSCKTKRFPLSVVPAQKTEFKAKHKVNRFSFDTKSPDDIVLASLNRFTRAQ